MSTAAIPDEAKSGPQNQAPQSGWRGLLARIGWRPVFLGILTLAVYGRVIVQLATDWWQISDFSHGFLVVPFAGYLIWVKRDTLRQIRPAPSWAGVTVVALGLGMMLLGSYGVEKFLTELSLVVVLAGLTLSFGGKELLRNLAFPLAILVLAIPIPTIIYNQLTLPLQILASKVASGLLPIFGVPVLRDGNVIQLPLMKLEVAEACSGIRSLMSLLTLSVFYGYFLEKSPTWRCMLALVSVPIAIAANAIRIVGTGLCVQYWDPDKALGFFHEFSGWVMFLVALACLYMFHWFIRRFRRKGAQA